MIRKILLLLFVAVTMISLLNCGNAGSDNKKESVSQNNKYAADLKVKAGDKEKSEKPGNPLVTLVEIGSLRCVPCKMMQPVLGQVEDKYGDKVKIVFHDVWTPEGRPYAKKFDIRAIPTQVFLNQSGKEFFRHTGFYPFKKIETLLKSRGIR